MSTNYEAPYAVFSVLLLLILFGPNILLSTLYCELKTN